MTWVRVDDIAPMHPKMIAIGPEAGWLWLCGLCYCNAHATDGRIPLSALHALYPNQKWTPRALKSLAQTLVTAGLWDLNEGHYTVHDYSEYQEEALKSSVEERREASKLRKRQQRERERLRTKPPDVTRDIGVTVTRDSTGTPARGTGGTPAWESPPFLTGVSQPPDPARPDPARPDQKREERERDARAPLDSRSSAEQVRGLLIRGYSQRYEKHANDAWVVGSNDAHIRQVTAYVLAAEGEPQAIVDELLDGYFRDEKRRAARWPWRWLAEDPGRHRPDQAAAKAAAERKRFWDEHAAREAARQAEQAKQPQPPREEMSEAEIEKMASDLMARLSTSMAMPTTKPKRKESEAAE